MAFRTKSKPVIVTVVIAALLVIAGTFYALQPAVSARIYTSTELPAIEKAYETAENSLNFPMAAFGVQDNADAGMPSESSCSHSGPPFVEQRQVLCYVGSFGTKRFENVDATRLNLDTSLNALGGRLQANGWSASSAKSSTLTIDAAIRTLQKYDDRVSYVEFSKTIDKIPCILNVSTALDDPATLDDPSKPYFVMIDLRCSRLHLM